MFASGKTTDTGLPPIILGGDNTFNVAKDESTTFSLSIDNADNIGLNDLVVLTIHTPSNSFPAISNSDYTTLLEENITGGNQSEAALAIYYGSFTGSLDITIDTTGKSGGCLVHYYWFKNVDTTSSIDVSATANRISSSDGLGNPYTVDSSSLSTATDNAVVINGVSVRASGSNYDNLTTPSNMLTVGDADYSRTFGGIGIKSVSEIAYATVSSAGSFDPASFGNWEGVSSYNYEIIDYTFALKPANPVQDTTNETAFNGGESVYVSHSDWANSATYDITINDTTPFSNGKTIGLGDTIVVGIAKNGPSVNVATSDFTLLHEQPTGGSGDPFAEVYYAVYNGTDLTITVSKFTTATEAPFVYHYYSIRYPDTSNTIDVSIDVDQIYSSSAVDHPSLTTATDNAIIVNGLFGYGVSGSSIVSDLSTPSNMSEAAPEAYGLTWDGSGTQYTTYTAAAQTQKSTAGSFDPASWGTTDSTVFSYTLAIKPS